MEPHLYRDSSLQPQFPIESFNFWQFGSIWCDFRRILLCMHKKSYLWAFGENFDSGIWFFDPGFII